MGHHRPSDALPHDSLAGLPILSTLTRIADEMLREVPVDRAAMVDAIERARARLAAVEAGRDDRAAIVLGGYLGNALRVLGRTDEAVALLEAAVARARSLGLARAEVANLIRLAEAHRYGGDHAAAEPLYRQALALTRARPDDLATLEDFALQHLGKCRLEQGDHAEALACFEAALALRRAKGDPELIASTEQALRAARSLAEIRP